MPVVSSPSRALRSAVFVVMIVRARSIPPVLGSPFTIFAVKGDLVPSEAKDIVQPRSGATLRDMSRVRRSPCGLRSEPGR